MNDIETQDVVVKIGPTRGHLFVVITQENTTEEEMNDIAQLFASAIPSDSTIGVVVLSADKVKGVSHYPIHETEDTTVIVKSPSED